MVRIFARTILLATALAMYAPAFAADALETKAAAVVDAKAAAAPIAEKTTAEAEKPAEKPLSAAEKETAIHAADAIAAFDENKIVGHAKPGQIYFQPAVSPMMHTIHTLHNEIMIIITGITLVVMGLLLYVMIRFSKKNNPTPRKFSHNTMVEIVWTMIPIILLLIIGVPTIRAHYGVYFNKEALEKPDLTLKVVGHQWYWSYEYPDYGFGYDSNIKADKDLLPNEPRLLAVDNAVVVPVNKVVKVQMTAADVIHDWAVPAFGVKKDAIPGRLNETWFKAEKEGIYYGQCSELCGKSHGFMPIMVVVVSDEEFHRWVSGAKIKYAANDTLQFAALR